VIQQILGVLYGVAGTVVLFTGGITLATAKKVDSDNVIGSALIGFLFIGLSYLLVGGN
jgi:hypothetical protein